MKKRYSTYIPILLICIDLLLINTALFFINDKEYLNLPFLGYINLYWIISSVITQLYKFQRHYNYFKLLSLLITHFFIFVLGFFSFFSIFREGEIVNNQTKVLVTLISCITLFRFLFLFALKKYRAQGNNFRKVVIIGHDKSAVKLAETFTKEKELGYEFLGYFSDKITSTTDQYLGDLKRYEDYILLHDVDEIYCSLTELKKKHIKKIKKFANRYNRVVKLIPNANELYNKNVVTEYYEDSLLVLKVKKMPFEFVENRIAKRVFDIIFSFFVCVFIISWLYPIIWIIIKLESKGPAIFKQKREGLNGNEFICYKFRSMHINSQADKISATKNDTRVTKFGSFLRRTSLDEVPQFFNVLLGDMSVVGPRPHMNEHSKQFDKEVLNYMKRKSVKPGITGLAQVSGYRGEIRKNSDIVNRVRFDVFYIENWSLNLDFKIILKTFLHMFKTEEKAY
ncbi:undecaprenyl-phosphate glucose phosphotransferase [Tenacibaculum agarivorans]|uniref:undecaprenyl-phosphate glucose phosphotransferase n=1 Tax=Tenacibaculum agarivorans TaxID=1908389 RepID=UPI00094BB07C|nr:undecaprenyl-phosphate glucose phosphotransferase [Tenacibaculum agarivorans]